MSALTPLPFYILDTDSFSLLQRRHSILAPRVYATPPDQLAVTAITVREVLNGWYGLLSRIKTPEQEAHHYLQLTSAVKTCAMVNVLPYTLEAIHRFDELRKAKLNIGMMDLRIAATTLEYGGILVTRNRRDFERIPELSIEDWAE